MAEEKKTVEQLVEETNLALDKKIEKATKGMLTSKELADYKAETEEKFKGLELPKETIDNLAKKHQELLDQVNEIGLDLKGMKEEGLNTIDDLAAEVVIEKAIKDNKENIASFKNSDSKQTGLVLNLKATVLRSAITSNTMAYRVDGIGQIQRRRIFLEELFTSGRVSANNHGVIRYVDQQALTDNSATISEGNAFPSSNITWIERNLPVQKVGDSIKLSREMMDDVDYVNSEVQNFLLRNVNLKVDEQLLSGDGVAPNLIGLATSATAFAAGAYGGTVADANIYDLIAIVSAQIQTDTSYLPTEVLMSQDTAVKMKLKKDGENNYLIPAFVVPTANGEITVDSMRVIVNSGVTTNTMYVGDFTRGTVYSSDDLQLEMGYENDDFTKDLVTVKARRRLALLIRNVDTTAFSYVSDVDAALAAIDNTP